MKKKFTWARYGGYECSSRGDMRFSAFFAIMPDNRTIEQHYQCDVKGYDVGGTNWRLGKGKPPLKSMSQDDLYQAYLDLWKVWAMNHTILITELAQKAKEHNYVLSDMFATSEVNQAHALADCLNMISIGLE